MAAVIFAGNTVKSLKANLDLNGAASVLTGTVTPTTTATSAPAGSLYLNTSSGNIYRKRDAGSTTNWEILLGGNAADLTETSFSAANNVVSATNVTGLSFANASVRSARILLSVYVNATAPLYEVYDILVVQKAASWDIAQTSCGDNALFVFTITTAGQIQYTNSNYTGFTTATLKFLAVTTSV